MFSLEKGRKEKKAKAERGQRSHIRIHDASYSSWRCVPCGSWEGVFQAEGFAAGMSLGLCLILNLSRGCIQSMTLSTQMHSYRPAKVYCSLTVFLGQGMRPRESKEWMPGVDLGASSWNSIRISQSLIKCDTLQRVLYWYSWQAPLQSRLVNIIHPTSFPVSRPLLSRGQGTKFLW